MLCDAELGSNPARAPSDKVGGGGGCTKFHFFRNQNTANVFVRRAYSEPSYKFNFSTKSTFKLILENDKA